MKTQWVAKLGGVNPTENCSDITTQGFRVVTSLEVFLHLDIRVQCSDILYNFENLGKLSFVLLHKGAVSRHQDDFLDPLILDTVL